ncbi:glycosyltransferase [Halioxenophilus sp. WMMB6]|uniref:glycosyltransferase n=1 Tax=Halioxenophilus sp. WMMB6 TaxID=3073815 RepID=UPI00295EA727|nr:glycosyltransferase [Halioxenophilus sp. WMMB6]
MTTIKFAPVLAGAAVGGAENFYARFVAEMQRRSDYSIRAFTRPNPRRQQVMAAAGVEMELFRFGGRFNFWDHYFYRRALRRFAPDIVMTFMGRATLLTPPGDYKLVARLGHYYDLKSYRHCDYWVGITRGICRHMIQGGLPAERVVHIPNFIDEVRAPALPRDSFQTPTDQPLLLAFGRLHRNKGFDVLLKALAKLPEGVLWLAGAGPEEGALKALAEELSITDRVRFLGWRDDINALLATADLFVCPSRHEGLGSILLEAWYHQCPVVAAASQGPSEVITHGVDGLLVPIDDVQALVAAISQVLNDRPAAAELVAQGASAYSRDYSVERIIEKYQQFFGEITQ